MLAQHGIVFLHRELLRHRAGVLLGHVEEPRIAGAVQADFRGGRLRHRWRLSLKSGGQTTHAKSHVKVQWGKRNSMRMNHLSLSFPRERESRANARCLPLGPPFPRGRHTLFGQSEQNGFYLRCRSCLSKMAMMIFRRVFGPVRPGQALGLMSLVVVAAAVAFASRHPAPGHRPSPVRVLPSTPRAAVTTRVTTSKIEIPKV